MATVEKSHVVDVEGSDCRSSGVGVCDVDFHSGERSDKEQRRSKGSGIEIVGMSERQKGSSASDCSVEVDLESVVPDAKVHLSEVERDCRICHLSLDAANLGSGVPIELGCSCKDDLAAAHKQCAEAWFKIKGNKTCEVCGSIAHNVAGVNDTELMVQWDETNDATETAHMHQTESRHFWQGHRFLNFLLACMVFAFVISWLFHFNVPS